MLLYQESGSSARDNVRAEAVVYAPADASFGQRMVKGIASACPGAAEYFREGQSFPGVGEALSSQAEWRRLQKTDKVFSVPSCPDLLIRRNIQSPFRRNGSFVTISVDEIELLAETRKYYDDFSNAVVSVPKFAFVAHCRSQTENPQALTVVERVHGTTSYDFQISPDCLKLFCMLEQAMARALEYQEEMAMRGAKFPFDVHPLQFMYGSTKSDFHKRLYFIDVEDRHAQLDVSTWKLTFNYEKEGSGTAFMQMPFAFFFQTTFEKYYDAVSQIKSATGCAPKTIAGKLIEFSDKYGPMYAGSLEETVGSKERATIFMNLHSRRRAILEALRRE